jgi:pimeloyl-ACP methyl ester carboxylesterase
MFGVVRYHVRMASGMAWVGRIFFLVVVVILLAVGGVLAWFGSWRSDRLAALAEVSSLAETSAGVVEFLSRGDGPAVLVLHDAPGGFDQAMLIGSGLAEAGYQILAPSRPGYLRTPLATGVLPEEQADAMAALLDDLGIQSVAVVSSGASTAVALQCALRYPDRVWAVACLGPVVTPQRVSADGAPPGEEIAGGLSGDMGSWLAVEQAMRDPAGFMNAVLGWSSSLTPEQRRAVADTVAGSLEQREWFQDYVGTWAPLSAREAGLSNDLAQMRVAPTGWANVGVPVVFLHGAADRFTPFPELQKVAGMMPKATLIGVPTAGRIVQLGPDRAMAESTLVDFLGKFSGGHGQP